jgi:hypothetical protein
VFILVLIIFILFIVCCVRPLFLTRFVCYILFERVVLFRVMCVICMLCLIVVSLPPGRNLFAVKIHITIIIFQEIEGLRHVRGMIIIYHLF